MEKLRVGIIGAGNIAQSSHLPVYMERTDVEVVAIADLNLARAQEAAKKFNIPHAYASVEELLEKEQVDYVDICVWNRSHAPVAIAAARAGKHILCEKPMALNLEHALEMEKEVRKAGVQFMMAVPTRYSSEAQLLMEMVNSGKLGDIYYERGNYDKAYEYYTAPGVVTVFPHTKEHVVNILNLRRANLIMIILGGLLTALLWMFLALNHVSAHNSFELLGLGIPVSVIATLIYASMLLVRFRFKYADLKPFLFAMAAVWAIFPLFAAIF